MKFKQFSGLLIVSLLAIASSASVVRAQNGWSRDPGQKLDDDYTKKIREYTTETFFNSPLTDYLPASPNVPTPKLARCFAWPAGVSAGSCPSGGSTTNDV